MRRAAERERLSPLFLKQVPDRPAFIPDMLSRSGLVVLSVEPDPDYTRRFLGVKHFPRKNGG
jgi:hypothetical protein